jgi:hypothetical protein
MDASEAAIWVASEGNSTPFAWSKQAKRARKHPPIARALKVGRQGKAACLLRRAPQWEACLCAESSPSLYVCFVPIVLKNSVLRS